MDGRVRFVGADAGEVAAGGSVDAGGQLPALLQDFAIDSLPVVEKDNERKILGTVTKTALLDYIIQEARQAEVKRQE